MGQLQTCGHVGWFSLYWLQVTYLLTTLILWTCIRKWAQFKLYCTILVLPLFSLHYFLFLDPQISAAEFTCPPWLSFTARKLITRILDPDPTTVSCNIWYVLTYYHIKLHVCFVLNVKGHFYL